MTTIFISHAASDPDWPDLAVEAVARRLESRGAEIWLDGWHERDVVRHKLPLGEWRAWMRKCLDSADHVLCLCSRRYAALAHRADKSVPEGRGIAFEAFEIEKRLYDQKQHNRDWVWLLRLEDDLAVDVVPTFLRDRCPEYGTPGEEQRLVEELVPETVQRKSPDIVQPLPAVHQRANPEPRRMAPLGTIPLNAQRRLVADRLAKTGVLWNALCTDDWSDDPPPPTAMASVHEFARWLSCASEKEATRAMFAARRALKILDLNMQRNEAAELATVSIYCLALCRCVNIDVLGAALRFPRSVAHSASLYCAVIATALFGGEIELLPSEHSERPDVRHAYEIWVPAAGDHREQVFERAVYQALFTASKSATSIALDDSALSDDERERLAERLLSIREVDRQSFTLVVHVDALYPPADAIADRYDVPVFVCDDQVASPLLGMTPARLIARINELWRELTLVNALAAGASIPNAAARDHPNDGNDMSGQSPAGSIHINVTGGSASVAVSTGDNSAARSGIARTLQASNGGQSWKELAQGVIELQHLLAAIPAERARSGIATAVAEAAAEIQAQSPSPNLAGRIKTVLERVHDLGAAVDGGEKIIQTCQRLLSVVRPLISS